MANPKLSDFDHTVIAKMDIRGLTAGYDYGSLTQTSTTDTYVFKRGGSTGTVMLTIVLTYTDSTKATLSNWTFS